MSSPPGPGSSWSQRYKANLAKLASGDAALIAEVIVELELRNQAAGLSAGEHRMLAKAWGLREAMRRGG